MGTGWKGSGGFISHRKGRPVHGCVYRPSGGGEKGQGGQLNRRPWWRRVMTITTTVSIPLLLLEIIGEFNKRSVLMYGAVQLLIYSSSVDESGASCHEVLGGGLIEGRRRPISFWLLGIAGVMEKIRKREKKKKQLGPVKGNWSKRISFIF